jgi:2,3-dihydroxyphenylpropionate 1,2-dioxygenase
MVDCSAPPRPSMRRAYEFGEAVGAAIRGLDADLNVLVLASGGLSHWVRPMSPYDGSTDEQTREFLIDGRDQVVEYNKAREENLAQRIANHHEGRINEDWDRWFLDRLTAGPLEDLLSIDSDKMEEVAGNGAHEVRSWIAGLGAWGGPVATVAYEPVPRWVTGMGLAAGFAAWDGEGTNG